MQRKIIIILTGFFILLTLSSCSNPPTDKNVWEYAKNEVIKNYAESNNKKIEFEKYTQGNQVSILDVTEDNIVYQVTGGFKYKDGSGDKATFTVTVYWDEKDKEFTHTRDLNVYLDEDSEKSDFQLVNTDEDSEEYKIYEAAKKYITLVTVAGDSDLISHGSYENSSFREREDGNYYVTSHIDILSTTPASYNYEMLLDSDYKVLDIYIPGSQGVFDRPMVYDILGESAATHMFSEDNSNNDTHTEKIEDEQFDENTKSLSQYSAEEIEYARVWLKVIGNKDVEELNVSHVKAGEPLNPYEENESAVFPEGLVRLSGHSSADGIVYYKSQGDETVSVYKVPEKWMTGVEGEKTMKEFTQDIINNPEEVQLDVGSDEEIEELIEKLVIVD